jgi:hypothetical protein
MRFDSTERWNTTSEQRDANWCDLQSVALHEFGHWIGLSHSYDIPTTDARTAVMRGEQYSDLGYGVIKRDIRQDDVNGFHAARNYATILTADDSMEYYGTWHFKFHQRVAGVGSRSLYCDGSGYAGTRCFIEYNGSGNSLYQDISPRGNYVNFRTMVARARFRNRTGQPASVTVAVWNLDNGQVVAQQVCNLPLDSSWVQCATPGFSTGGNNLRQEVYNNTGGNVDIDTFILG